MQVTLTNASADQIFLRSLYAQLDAGDSVTTERFLEDLKQDPSLMAYIADGTVTASIDPDSGGVGEAIGNATGFDHALAPAAAGVAVHATIPAGAAFDITTGFTNPTLPGLPLQLVLGGGGTAADVTVEGTDYRGKAIERTVLTVVGGTVVIPAAFVTVTRIYSLVDPGDTLDLETGPGFGIGTSFTNLLILQVGTTPEAALLVDGDTGGIIPTTAPNGVLNYLFSFSSTELL